MSEFSLNRGWAIIDMDGNVRLTTITYYRAVTIKKWLANWSGRAGQDWRYWRRRGYGVRRVRVVAT